MTWKTYHQPSEAEETKPEEVSENVEDVAPAASPIDPLAQLEAEVKAGKDEAAGWKDRFLRKAAELENFRKRSEKEKTEGMVFAKSSVLIEFLPVADACERALASLAETNADEFESLLQFKQGVELLYKQLLDTLGRTGITPIEAEGKPFDPRLHEAISRQEKAEAAEDTVVKELRKGYLFKDRLLRPAQVIVAVHPQEKTKNPDE
jgi:molecular chaperone GrpE